MSYTLISSPVGSSLFGVKRSIRPFPLFPFGHLVGKGGKRTSVIRTTNITVLFLLRGHEHSMSPELHMSEWGYQGLGKSNLHLISLDPFLPSIFYLFYFHIIIGPRSD